jgi:imidazole glycerol-phosphate synthase subunit HisH
MSNRIVIVDYGMGNIHSVVKKIKHFSDNIIVSADPIEILKSDKVILVGVGHFRKAMENLQRFKLIDVLNQVAFDQKKPILGICLGMQLMGVKSEEGNVNGLGWINADVKKIKVEDTIKHKVPHMGWNEITIKKESILMKGIADNSEFYFAHSYYMEVFDSGSILNETDYSFRFVTAIEQENIFGVQYHPEKSHDIGEILLSNFVKM